MRIAENLGLGGSALLDPLAAPRDHRQHRGPRHYDSDIVLQLRHVLGCRATSENDHGSMNFDSNTASLPSIRPSKVAAIH
jgi:hypothetical protein